MTAPQSQAGGGVMSWFARNHVAANLLMIAIVATGALVARDIRQEIYPTFSLDEAEIEVSYRGAGPEEVERSIILPIEAELRGLSIIRDVRAIAREGEAEIIAEFESGVDRNRGLQEVTAAIQRIDVFPDDAEAPVIGLNDGRRRGVLYLSLYGDLDRYELAQFAREIEEKLLSEPDISIVDIRGLENPETLIEVEPAQLRSLGLRMVDIADAIRAAAVDVPAGSMRTTAGDYALRTLGRRDFAGEYADIPIISGADGSKVRLGDIARITDAFEESQRENYFNGRPSIWVGVYSAESQSPMRVAEAVKAFIERERPRLPPSVGMTVTFDRSRDYAERVDTLIRNGSLGLLLVLLALGFFLEIRVALWTAVGIPVSIIGALILLPTMDASINMISLFGFIVTLGIVVDDAVVVGEDIFHKTTLGMSRIDAAIAGVKAMATPVIFAVATNIIAFLPLLFVPAETGRFFFVLPAVVIAVFTVSLVECLLILPAHLGSGKDGARTGWFGRLQERQTRLRVRLDQAMDRGYGRFLERALRYRSSTALVFVALLIVGTAYFASGRVRFSFRPTIETPFIQAEIELPSGTPVARTREVAFEIEEAARRAIERNGEEDILIGLSVSVAFGGGNQAEVSARLVQQSERKITGEEFANLWREEIGEIPDLESIFFDYLIGPGGSAEIDIQLSHPDVATLRQAATELAAAVGAYPGVEDVKKGFGGNMPEFQFEITPEGRSLGLTARELGWQVRHAFYGAEALRQPRERDEVRVMVKLPQERRQSLGSMDSLLIRAPGGEEIPLRQAARVIESEAPTRIERFNGARVVNVTANVLPGVTTGNRVLSALERRELTDILGRYPGLRHSFEGEQREQADSMRMLSWGLVGSVFAIYAIMAALLRGYGTAFIILLMIPWSLLGAVAGHLLFGFDLSVFSVFGMIALCGMVVNGAFVLAVTRNDLIASGVPPIEAIQRAAKRRFRPIVLTAATTFLGLGPMIFETSIQAQFLVPMAISLGIGTLVSAVVTLVLIPALMALVVDWTGKGDAMVSG